MSSVWRLVLVLLLWMPAQMAQASFEQSRAWFERLDADARKATQSDLILAGHYSYLVDGQFGRGTFDALTAFQKSQGDRETGVLTEGQRGALHSAASETGDHLGIELVSDMSARVAMMIPAGLLSVRQPTDAGTSYVSADGELSLETMHASLATQSFQELFDVMISPDPERTVTYRSFGAGRFVVSGRIGGYSFYTMFVNAGGEAIGYSLAWGETYQQVGPIASVYIASHFTPMGALPPAPEIRKAEGAAGGPPPEAFQFPLEAPDVLVFSADITDSTPRDFARALRNRPTTRIVALNSPGGSVDAALAMAREVRKRGLVTYVPGGMGCYSACAYIFLAGTGRQVDGELGVHQISAEVADLVLAQTTLGDVLDELEQFGVRQQVISHMLRTPPDDMYVFPREQIEQFGIEAGERVEVAGLGLEPGGSEGPADEAIYVQLATLSDREAARRSVEYLQGRWASIFADTQPEVRASGNVFRVMMPMPSIERANAVCAAIKADGGGCYVTGGPAH